VSGDASSHRQSWLQSADDWNVTGPSRYVAWLQFIVCPLTTTRPSRTYRSRLAAGSAGAAEPPTPICSWRDSTQMASSSPVAWRHVAAVG